MYSTKVSAKLVFERFDTGGQMEISRAVHTLDIWANLTRETQCPRVEHGTGLHVDCLGDQVIYRRRWSCTTNAFVSQMRQAISMWRWCPHLCHFPYPWREGMVDHDTLHEAYARAGFMLYPSAYPGERFPLDIDRVLAWWHIE